MIGAVDPARGHAGALENEADAEDQRQHAHGVGPTFTLPGVQKGEGETNQRCDAEDSNSVFTSTSSKIIN